MNDKGESKKPAADELSDNSGAATFINNLEDTGTGDDKNNLFADNGQPSRPDMADDSLSESVTLESDKAGDENQEPGPANIIGGEPSHTEQSGSSDGSSHAGNDKTNIPADNDEPSRPDSPPKSVTPKSDATGDKTGETNPANTFGEKTTHTEQTDDSAPSDGNSHLGDGKNNLPGVNCQPDDYHPESVTPKSDTTGDKTEEMNPVNATEEKRPNNPLPSGDDCGLHGAGSNGQQNGDSETEFKTAKDSSTEREPTNQVPHTEIETDKQTAELQTEMHPDNEGQRKSRKKKHKAVEEENQNLAERERARRDEVYELLKKENEDFRKKLEDSKKQVQVLQNNAKKLDAECDTLKHDNKQREGEINMLRELQTTASMRLDETEEQLRVAKSQEVELKCKYDNLMKEMETAKQQCASQVNALNEAYESLMKQMTTKERKHEKEIQEKVSLNKTLIQEKEYLERKHEKEMKEQVNLYKPLKKEKEDLERKHKKEMKKQVNLCETLTKEKEDSERKHEKEMNEQVHLYNSLKKEKGDCERKHEKEMKEQVHLYNSLKKDCERQNKEAEQNIRKLKQSCREKEDMCQMQEHNLQCYKRAYMDLETKVNGLEDYIRRRDVGVTKLEANVASLEADKKDLLMRLSKMAGEKLTDSNPAIADLSDVFRPTKLAEMFSEVYDNEWTDAFEERCDFQDEEDAIIFILKILHETYDLCKDITGQQQKDLIRAASSLRIAFPGPETKDSRGQSESNETNDEPEEEQTSDADHKADSDNIETTEEESKKQTVDTATLDTKPQNDAINTTLATQEDARLVSHEKAEEPGHEEDTKGNRGISETKEEQREEQNVDTLKSDTRPSDDATDSKLTTQEDAGLVSTETLSPEKVGEPGYKDSSTVTPANRTDLEPREEGVSKGGTDNASLNPLVLKDETTEKIDKGLPKEKSTNGQDVDTLRTEDKPPDDVDSLGADADSVPENTVAFELKEKAEFEEKADKAKASSGTAGLAATENKEKLEEKEDSEEENGVNVNNFDEEDNSPDGLSEDNNNDHHGEESTTPEKDRDQHMTSTVTQPKEISKDLDEKELKALKEIQKATAYVLSKDVEKSVTEILKVHLRIDDDCPNTAAYLRKCVFLCWKMVLHDPPLYVEHVAANESDSNLHERYRAYTKTGTKLQYLVWPALFLHKDGAVLNKGVAQFTNS